MQQTIQLGQVQPSVLSKESIEKYASVIRQWWGARSESFSLLAGEDFTHGQVIVANLCFILGLVAVMAAVAVLNNLFGMEGGAL